MRVGTVKKNSPGEGEREGVLIRRERWSDREREREKEREKEWER